MSGHFTAILENSEGFTKHMEWAWPPPQVLYTPIWEKLQYQPEEDFRPSSMVSRKRSFHREQELYPRVWLYKELD